MAEGQGEQGCLGHRDQEVEQNGTGKERRGPGTDSKVTAMTHMTHSAMCLIQANQSDHSPTTHAYYDV